MKFVDQIAQVYQKHINARIRVRILLIITALALFTPLIISIVLPTVNRYLINRRINDLEKQSWVLASEKEKATERSVVEYLSNEILVKVKDKVKSKIKTKPTPADTGILSINEINKANKVNSFKRINAPSKETNNKNHKIFNWYKVTLSGKRETITEKPTEEPDKLNSDNEAAQNLKKIIAKFHADPNVETAEPNYVVHNSAIPNDPYYSSSGTWGQGYQDLYGMHKIDAAGAWGQVTDSSNVAVADIDTGVDRNHEDIKDNMWVNTAEIPNNGIDDDGNGYRDDYYGWDWYNHDNDPIDDHGHGTHTAGTIAAKGNNEVGVVGVSWVGKIMALKFLNSSGSGYTSGGASALRYAADMGAKISSNSWSCSCSSSIIADAVSYEHNVGMVVVAAAGNDIADVMSYSPASLTEVITVAASDYYDSRAIYSNFGIKIDVAAPGNSILSLKSAVSPMCTGSAVVGLNYCVATGTSMATPHVAGLAALIFTKHPEFTNEQVRQGLRTSADDINQPGFDIYTGHGRINASRALTIGSALTVKFSSFPDDLTNLQNLEIRGTAAGPSFKNYELSYGQGLSPTSWIQISSSASPVVNGVLGNWQVSNLETGRYAIRLVATDTSGRIYDSYTSAYKEKWVNLLKRNVGNQLSPRVYGQKIVWWDTRNDKGDIYLYDLGTNTERRITTNSSGQFSPDIWGDKIVWYDDRNGQYDIYLYDLATNTERRITTEVSNQGSPRIFGDKIIWYGVRNDTKSNIYLFDLRTNTERQITDSNDDQFGARIYGDKIVWYGYSRFKGDRQSDIYLYDISTDTQIQLTNDSASQRTPDIWGDKIVWWESLPVCCDWGLYVYNLNTKTKQKILETQSIGWVFTPTINNNTVAWIDKRNGNFDIVAYDLSTNTERIITSQWRDQTSPAIQGDRIFWSDYRDISYLAEIYYYDPPSSPDDTTPPTAPANLAATAVSSSQINLGWTASTDNVGVTGYEVYRDSSPTPIATVTTTSYSNTGLSSSTTYSYFVRAKDEAGNRSGPSNTASATTFVYDIEAPTVNPLTPENSAIVSGDVNISATASDNVAVTKVEFLIDGVLKYTDTTEPYGFTWDSTKASDGSHTITYKAYDPGNRSNAKNRTVTVDNTVPTVSITGPFGGSVVSGTATITATASDSTSGVVKVEFLVNGVVKWQDTTSPYTYSWTTTSVSDGSHSIVAKAYDAAGNLSSVSADVIVDNTKPSVTVTSPSNGSVVSGDTAINVSAFDSGSNVTRVEFLVDGVVKAQDTAAPYSYIWDTTTYANGSHTLTANAWDAAGNYSVATTVTVTVNNGVGDSQPPSKPTGLAGRAVSSSQVNLTWSLSSDNVGVVGYNIIRNGAKIATLSGTSFGDGTVSPNTTYTYSVSAFDAADNASEKSALVTVTTPQPLPTIITIKPTADATISRSYPSSNYGASQYLIDDASPYRNFLMNFSITGIGVRTVTSAKLRLYVQNPSPLGGIFYKTTTTTWSEKTVTWNSRPAVSSRLATLGRVYSGRWYSVDLTKYITKDGTLSLRVMSTYSDGAIFYSKEKGSSYAPQLVITVQ
ncbi:MAG: hypothetical protein A2Z42_04560 [Candidatus Woykebacteria bacterium RBG_19FT_COMBO_43_10]|uniref:Fibronectin type-III domain-containing protein n=1 Tax=Candidatus Woykebacteria bacterium RBG_19FT_COMBO_43_10 TaxID=1802598 RepID=A0A1G1WFD1_9BACT|nr:MAG: hypothetical protein A2Z42_04560 [Candidatus Woykebacteria bacterium RBG_19FT_COMBO_43_10]